jgi:hypothetical protein
MVEEVETLETGDPHEIIVTALGGPYTRVDCASKRDRNALIQRLNRTRHRMAKEEAKETGLSPEKSQVWELSFGKEGDCVMLIHNTREAPYKVEVYDEVPED